jgi:phosphohistidine phosphatase SixA
VIDLPAIRPVPDHSAPQTAEVVGLALKSHGRPTMRLSSPYDRARQAADIAAKELDYKGHIIESEALVRHSSPEAVWREIRDHVDQSAILLASHEQLLSHTVAYLLNSPALRVEIKKAAMVRIEVESLRAAPHGILRWMIVPKMA